MLSRFLKSKKGVAATEFAIIMPALLLGFLGANEVSSAVRASQKVSQTASTVADLVAQSSTISNTDIANIFSAANAITFPYAPTGEKIVVTSLVDIGGGKGKVAWSDAQNGSPRAVGSTMTVPTGTMVTNGSVILAEVSYEYTPTTSYVMNGTFTMSSQFYSRPRRVLAITRTS
jgi:Flp pilus assembly protein TadG